MRKLLIAAMCAALVLILAAGALALDVPPYKGRVNDLGNMMSPATRQALESQLAELERTDSTQVAILTIPSLEGDSLEDFSIRVAEAWKAGQKGTDNGVILLASKEDRILRIEVGYGLEGVLTDVLSGQIITNVIGPRFKAGDFDGGFSDGVTAITGAVRGEYVAAPSKQRRSKRGVLSLIIIPMALFMFFTEMFGKRRRSGQLAEDGTTTTRSGVGSTASTLLLLSMLGGSRGGGGGFGGGGGGGFGGFGGGGFGGGGASGGW
ncbi:MAG: TPM domain-containing protein [Pseudodesulfovibrio sp.]|nr:TPM domain-containing protein [Pseudodesulfovibrio sp.]